MLKRLSIFLILILWAETSRSQRLLVDVPGPLYERLGTSRPDTNRIQILLKLSDYYLNKWGRNEAEVDSARALYKRAELLADKLRSEKWQRACLKFKGTFFILTGNLGKGKACYLKLANYYHQIGDIHSEAQVWWDLGLVIPVETVGWRSEKKSDFAIAGRLFASIGNKEKQIGAIKEVADVHLNEGLLGLAEKELLKVLADYKAINFKKLHHTYFLLSAISRLRSDLKGELYYDLEAKKSIVATKDTADAAFLITKLGDCYLDLGMLDNSLASYKEALYKYHSARDIVYGTVYRIVSVMIAQKKAGPALEFLTAYKRKYPPVNTFDESQMYAAFGDCYWALNNISGAENAYRRMIVLNNLNFKSKFLPVEIYVKTYQLICKFYIKTRQFKKADYYLRVLEKSPKKLVSSIQLAQWQLMRFKIDSASGSYLQAIRHYQQYERSNDSVFNASKINEVASLQARFETEAKDRDIQVQSKNILLQKKDILLLTKQNQLEHYQVEKSQLRGNLITGCAVLLILLLLIGYSRYRLKIKSNLELQRQQQLITAKNNELEHLLNENQWLLREVHHRVKNNLQIVISLLNSQSAYLHDEVALNAVLESKMRVQAMSLIHQKLYGNEDVSTIFLPEYIRDLVGYLKDSFRTAKSVYIDQDIAPISLDVSQAVPVGLILNEAITNAFKYAFPFAESDVLTIKLSQKLPFGVSLTISDNGRGLTPDIDLKKIKSFGLKLIRGLTEDLGGNLTIYSNKGTTLTIDFEVVPLLQRKEFKTS